MFLLDTNVVSELRRVAAGRGDPAVAAWARDIPAGRSFVSAITIGELEQGVLLTERRNPDAGHVLRRWIDAAVHRDFAERVIPADATVARIAAALHVPDPAPLNDALIAACALANRMTLVTRNAADFERFDGLEVLNPWTP
jgi:predicted nucleic acid-binding protein